MSRRPIICFTFVGDVTRDSRLRRMASAATEVGEVTVLQLSAGAFEPEAAIRGERGKERGEEEDYRIISIPMRGSLRQALPRYWRQAAFAVRELGADIVVASDLYSLPAAARGARRRKTRLLYDARELYSSVAALQGRGLMQRFWTAVERRYGAKAHAVTTVNESIAAILRERFRDVRVLRNVPDFAQPARSNRLRETLDIPEGRRILLSQGGLQKGRGALPLVGIMPGLPDCALVFLGDGTLRGEIEAAAEIHGVSDRVHVLSAVPSTELALWTASADVGLCLIENLGRSYYLSLPNKLFEYIACGVPVVGSDFPEIGALLRESGAGIAVDPEDDGLVLRAIRTLLDDRTRYDRAREACHTASVRYTWEREKSIWTDLLSQ